MKSSSVIEINRFRDQRDRSNNRNQAHRRYYGDLFREQLYGATHPEHLFSTGVAWITDIKSMWTWEV